MHIFPFQWKQTSEHRKVCFFGVKEKSWSRSWLFALKSILQILLVIVAFSLAQQCRHQCLGLWALLPFLVTGQLCLATALRHNAQPLYMLVSPSAQGSRLGSHICAVAGGRLPGDSRLFPPLTCPLTPLTPTARMPGHSPRWLQNLPDLDAAVR